ncbi:MAG: histidine phosphatase family protein [Flavobacteriales bacterium]|nr:histidine phosphatase family protein [Flavobacteriales bacterium]
MKRSLILIRHAKSSWNNERLDDKDRPLNKRGERDCPHMARHLAGSEACPDMIVSSHALRAHTTAKAYAAAFGIADDAIKLDERIYEAPVSRLVEVINDFSDGHSSVIMFGHNPGFSYLTQYLTGELIQMPTNGVVKIEMDVDSWQYIGTNCGSLTYHDFPKQHEALR